MFYVVVHQRRVSLAQMEAKLRSYRESSLSELMKYFWSSRSLVRDSNPKGRKPISAARLQPIRDVLGIFRLASAHTLQTLVLRLSARCKVFVVS